MPRAKKRARPPEEGLRQLRTAVLRRWRKDDDPVSVAARLRRPVKYVQLAIHPDVERVAGNFCRGVTADELADRLELPRAFVVFVIKRIYARQRAPELRRRKGRRRISEAERSDFVASASRGGGSGSVRADGEWALAKTRDPARPPGGAEGSKARARVTSPARSP